jgi:hypothetical protein
MFHISSDLKVSKTSLNRREIWRQRHKTFFSVADERSSLLENTELAPKNMAGTNTPAYFAGTGVTKKSCLTMLTTGVHVLKHCRSMQNRLECLFLPNLSSLV